MTDFDSELLLDKLIAEAARRGELQAELSRAREQHPLQINAIKELEDVATDAARKIVDLRKEVHDETNSHQRTLHALRELLRTVLDYAVIVDGHPRGRFDLRKARRKLLDQQIDEAQKALGEWRPF